MSYIENKIIHHLKDKVGLREADRLVNALKRQIRADALNQAIEAARGEYLTDATGTDEDEAYNRAVSDVVAAIGDLPEGGGGRG